MSKVKDSLVKLFQQHRVIFWYDGNQEMMEQYEDVELQGVEKLVVMNNQFYIKYHVCREAPAGKFLLYFPDPKPEDYDNWLLDLELSHHVFNADQESMILQELGLGYHLKDFVSAHIQFFKSNDRKEKLRELISTDDSHDDLRTKMLAVVFGTDHINLVAYLQMHAIACNDGTDRYDKDLDRFNLSNFYWQEVSRKYGYKSETPSIYDFLLEVFNGNFSLGTKSEISRDARILLSIWKDTLSFRAAFEGLSSRIAQDLKLESRLQEAVASDLMQDDTFRLIDLRIISEFVKLQINESISLDQLLKQVKQRENKYWYDEFRHFYEALRYAAEMMDMVKKHGNLVPRYFAEGLMHYVEKLYRIDLCYRKFIWNYRKTGQNRVLSDLAAQVEKVYSNDWLLPFNDRWQAVVHGLNGWLGEGADGQRRFFANHVRPVIEKGQRVFVIISDALRYECGHEFAQRVQGENRFDATMEFMVSSLPSYTQLGMASLLPHAELAMQDGTDLVLADGLSTQGTQARSRILEAATGGRGLAITAEEFMKQNSHSGREFVKAYDVIYIYHDQIDKTGDDKTTEDKVFDAVESELEFLMDLVRKIANMNGVNMILTADHGFIYQHQALQESEFSEAEISGEVWKQARRFVLGSRLQGNASVQHFDATQLGLTGGVEALIPKSINRLRVKGAGSRFVHGGATLQEVVVPLIKISKKRQDTTSQVEVDIIKATDKITTNILAVSFLQSNLVDARVLPRQLRMSIVAADGEVLSDVFSYLFDIEEGSERQREVKHRFQLSSKASGAYKNQQVRLLLEEPVEGSSRWKTYKEYHYLLNITFTNDFDDF